MLLLMVAVGRLIRLIAAMLQALADGTELDVGTLFGFKGNSSLPHDAVFTRLACLKEETRRSELRLRCQSLSR